MSKQTITIEMMRDFLRFEIEAREARAHLTRLVHEVGTCGGPGQAYEDAAAWLAKPPEIVPLPEPKSDTRAG